MGKIGALVYDEVTGRMDIRFSLEEFYGGLHCGTGLDVLLNDEWVPTRIEMNMERQWYLVGIETGTLLGLTVKI